MNWTSLLPRLWNKDILNPAGDFMWGNRKTRSIISIKN